MTQDVCNQIKCSEPDSITRAAEVLNNDGLAIVPTDTVYGIAALGTSSKARQKLLEIKPRPETKPISFLIAGVNFVSADASFVNADNFVHTAASFVNVKKEGINELLDINKLVEINETGKGLMAKHWPGALTIVLAKTQLGKSSEIFAGDEAAFGGDTVGLRCPDHAWLRELISATGPLATTSANLHQDSVAQNVEHLAEEIKQGADIICDGGKLGDVASSVVDLTGEKAEVLRQGTINL